METELTEEELRIPPGITTIDCGRSYLIQLMANRTLSTQSAETLSGQFNDFITKNDFKLPVSLQAESGESYNWELLRLEEPCWRDIADIALRLLNCSCSEASCERTISTQRLIMVSRHMKSTKRLLDARLTLMRALK
jgi:hypothetical protein